MERIVVRFRETEYNSEVNELKRGCSSLNNLIDDLKQGGYDVTPAIFDDIKTGRSESLYNHLKVQISSKLEQANLVFKSFKENAIKEALDDAFVIYRKYNCSFPAVCEFIEGKAVIPQQYFDNLRSNYENVIATEQGKRIYELQQTFVETLNEINKISNVPLGPLSLLSTFWGPTKIFAANIDLAYDKNATT